MVVAKKAIKSKSRVVRFTDEEVQALRLPGDLVRSTYVPMGDGRYFAMKGKRNFDAAKYLESLRERDEDGFVRPLGCEFLYAAAEKLQLAIVLTTVTGVTERMASRLPPKGDVVYLREVSDGVLEGGHLIPDRTAHLMRERTQGVVLICCGGKRCEDRFGGEPGVLVKGRHARSAVTGKRVVVDYEVVRGA